MIDQTFENKNKYKDFDLSFSRNPLTNDLAKKTDTNAITQSIKNLLFTAYYERPFRPRVGSNIRTILFEPADYITMGSLQNSIEETIKNYEPRIILQDVSVADRSDSNSYSVNIQYQLYKNDAVKNIQITLRRLR